MRHPHRPPSPHVIYLHMPEMVSDISNCLLRQASRNPDVDEHVRVLLVGVVSQAVFENFLLLLVPWRRAHLSFRERTQKSSGTTDSHHFIAPNTRDGLPAATTSCLRRQTTSPFVDQEKATPNSRTRRRHTATTLGIKDGARENRAVSLFYPPPLPARPPEKCQCKKAKPTKWFVQPPPLASTALLTLSYTSRF